MRAGRDFYRDMSPAQTQFISTLLQSPGLVLIPLGLTSKLPPFNTVISNVPGIQQRMYWNGARLDGSYPVSIVTDGIAVNITMVTNDKNVDFGIIACRRSVPQVQRLIDYMEDALVELENAAGLASPKKKPSRKTVTRKKTPVRPKRAAGKTTR